MELQNIPNMEWSEDISSHNIISLKQCDIVQWNSSDTVLNLVTKALSIFKGVFLLTLSAKIDHPPESPFWCFEIIVALFVRLWTAISCNIQDVGLSEVFHPLNVAIP